MKNSFLRRVAASAVMASFLLVGLSGCTVHEVVLDAKGMGLSSDPRNATIGHIDTKTYGFTALLIFPFMPKSDDPEVKSNSLQYSYNKMAEEAGRNGASKLLDLHSSKGSLWLMGPFLQLFWVNTQANMTK
jgi:hypothetical protein